MLPPTKMYANDAATIPISAPKRIPPEAGEVGLRRVADDRHAAEDAGRAGERADHRLRRVDVEQDRERRGR